MRRAQVLVSLAFILVSAMAQGFAGPEKQASSLTGNDLARELAATARTAGATEVSRTLLNADLGRWANAPLTEGIAVNIMRAAGIPTITSDPGRLLTRERADALVRQFKSSLASPDAPLSMSAAGRAELPAGLDDCVVAKNHGKCVECCKDLGGGASSCAKACHVINKPSPAEPLP